MTDTELDDLESGLVHPFWARVKAQWLGEWGPKGDMYLQAVKVAMNNVDDVIQRRQLEQVMFAQDVVMKLVEWPEHRLEVLHGKADDIPLTYQEKIQALRAQDRAFRGPRRGHL